MAWNLTPLEPLDTASHCVCVCVREIERQIRQKENSRKKRTEKLWSFLKKRQIPKPKIGHFFARQADQRSSINSSLPPPPPRSHRKLCLQTHVFAQNEYSPEFEHSKKILFHGRETPFWLAFEWAFLFCCTYEGECVLPALIYVNEAVLFGELLVPRLLRRSCRFGFFREFAMCAALKYCWL